MGRSPGRVRHFTDYERPQPGWMDPLAAELAELARLREHVKRDSRLRDLVARAERAFV